MCSASDEVTDSRRPRQAVAIPAQTSVPAPTSVPAQLSDDPRALRHALGQFATGVAVVTARGPNGRLTGVTVNSFNSVSLDPPLILFSLHRQATRLTPLLEAEGFAVNVLGRAQRSLSDRFARASDASWDGVGYRSGRTGAPCLQGALAHLECRLHASYDGGDHLIVLGRVIELAHHADDEPLIFFRGRYHELAV
ncbi:MAG: flavin reductase family protein [Burkholderiaceae bacterium]